MITGCAESIMVIIYYKKHMFFLYNVKILKKYKIKVDFYNKERYNRNKIFTLFNIWLKLEELADKTRENGGDTMKEWSNPELWSLDAEATEAGIKGISCDGVWLEHITEGHGDAIVIGTSGCADPNEWKPVPPGTKLH